MAFTLTCLGTDTSYKSSFEPQNYPRGETLSLASFLVEPIHTQESIAPLHINAENIAVIDGPTTLGTEVYERINLGVNVLLKAIANGKHHLSIIAHSRGACESILIAHEMDRLKKIFLDPENINLTSLLEQKIKTTIGQDVFFEPDQGFLTEDNFQKLKTKFPDVQLKMFLLDPVPGGGYFGIPRLKWHHDLFYSLPDIVVDYEQYIYENERTRCFKAIAPNPNKGKYTISALPGHHGTGSGNPFDQAKTYAKDPQWIEKTSGVQNLIFAKLLNFLRVDGQVFKQEAFEYEHTHELKTIAYRVLSDASQFEAVVFEQKNHILENLEFYQKFNQTCYPYLGPEESLIGLFVKTSASRIIHWGSSADHQLDDKIPNKRSSQFLDMEHMQLHLKQLTQERFDLDRPIDCLITLKAFSDLEWRAQVHLVDIIFSHLCQSYVADQYDLDDGQQQDLAGLIKEILERQPPPPSLTDSLKELIEFPRVRINEAFSAKAEDLTEKIGLSFASLKFRERLQEDLQILQTLVKELPRPLIECIANLKFNQMVDVRKLNSCRQFQEDYSDVFEILESWTKRGIEQKQIAVLKNLCLYHTQCLSLQKHSTLLKTDDFKYISEETVIKLVDLKRGLEKNFKIYLSHSNWSLIKLFRLLNDVDFLNLFHVLDELKLVHIPMLRDLERIEKEISDFQGLIWIVGTERGDSFEELEKKAYDKYQELFHDFEKFRTCFAGEDHPFFIQLDECHQNFANLIGAIKNKQTSLDEKLDARLSDFERVKIDNTVPDNELLLLSLADETLNKLGHVERIHEELERYKQQLPPKYRIPGPLQVRINKLVDDWDRQKDDFRKTHAVIRILSAHQDLTTKTLSQVSQLFDVCSSQVLGLETSVCERTDLLSSRQKELEERCLKISAFVQDLKPISSLLSSRLILKYEQENKAITQEIDKIKQFIQQGQVSEEKLTVYNQWQKALIDLTRHYQANLNKRDESGVKSEMIRQLMEKFDKTRPSYVNIHYFYEHLEPSQAQLVCHRDEGWKRFLMSALNLMIWGGLITSVVALSLHGLFIPGAVIGALTFIALSLLTYNRYQTYGRFNFFSSNGQVYVEALNQMQAAMTV